ncbi:MAG: acylphosphatase [Leptolyngbyaceae cyanobacterium]
MTTTRLSQHRICLTVQGTVQGVGFRPFVYQLATELDLAGGVKNTAQGAVIEIEGSEATLGLFVQRLQAELPPPRSDSDLDAPITPRPEFKAFSDLAV